MKRRAFLGFLGGAAAAGPSVAKSAAEMTTADLSIGRMGISALSGAHPMANGSAGIDGEDRSWARTALKRMLGVTAAEREMRKRRYWSNDLDPQIAALRSVSLINRIRMSRDAQFERYEAAERSYLEGVIAGLWS